jgi:hypothetical protein
VTPEEARTIIEGYTTHDPEKVMAAIDAARANPLAFARILTALDGIYGPQNGPMRMRKFLKDLIVREETLAALAPVDEPDTSDIPEQGPEFFETAKLVTPVENLTTFPEGETAVHDDNPGPHGRLHGDTHGDEIRSAIEADLNEPPTPAP